MSSVEEPGDDLALSSPDPAGPGTPKWRVVAHNRRVFKGWLALCRTLGQNAVRCHEHLSLHPDRRIPGRCFPLKHSRYQGCWEYEIGAGDRIFYKLEPERQTVLVYYAGPHPSEAPYPPEAAD